VKLLLPPPIIFIKARNYTLSMATTKGKKITLIVKMADNATDEAYSKAKAFFESWKPGQNIVYRLPIESVTVFES
jgi:hypothetical protein